MPQSVDLSPNYVAHRLAVAAVDTNFTTESMGINMSGREKALIQVLPSGGANPNVTVYFWSAAAAKFIPAPADAITGAGADKPYEFVVDAFGRIMLVAVTTIAAGQCDVYVSSFGLNNLLG